MGDREFCQRFPSDAINFKLYAPGGGADVEKARRRPSVEKRVSPGREGAETPPKLRKIKFGTPARVRASALARGKPKAHCCDFPRALKTSGTTRGPMTGRIATCGYRVECIRANRCPDIPDADERFSVRGRAAFLPTGRSIRKCAEWRTARGTWSSENPSIGR
jgi:hypothetical protein